MCDLAYGSPTPSTLAQGLGFAVNGVVCCAFVGAPFTKVITFTHSPLSYHPLGRPSVAHAAKNSGVALAALLVCSQAQVQRAPSARVLTRTRALLAGAWACGSVAAWLLGRVAARPRGRAAERSHCREAAWLRS